ncbi:hypothetical protein D3C79_1031830 [compost metagenome]
MHVGLQYILDAERDAKIRQCGVHLGQSVIDVQSTRNGYRERLHVFGESPGFVRHSIGEQIAEAIMVHELFRMARGPFA